MGAIIIKITKLVKHFTANVTDVEIHTLVKMYIIKGLCKKYSSAFWILDITHIAHKQT